MKSLKLNIGSFKKIRTLSTLLVIFIILGSCNKDDSPEMKPIPEIDGAETPDPVIVEKTIFGDWEITSGNLRISNSKFVHINEDNTINILSEDDRGFKRDFTTNITISENQLIMSGGYGSEINNYVLNEDTLTIMPPGEGEVLLVRNNSIPEVTEWIKVLTILEEGDAPWDEDSDIAFNGTHILFGNGYEADNIGLVNPENFNLDGEILTTQSAFAVEVEKFDNPGKYIFQSSNGSAKFKAFREDTNAEIFQSLDLGAWIQGLASVDDKTLWVSSGNENTLYLYNYYFASDEILSTVEVDFQPKGLDFQNGFLYVSDGVRIHKCQTSPEFKVVETYKIEGYSISGIAFDGTNFWFNARSDQRKLIKSSLTL